MFSDTGNVSTTSLGMSLSSTDSGKDKHGTFVSSATRLSAATDPQGYPTYVGDFRQNKRRVLVESVGQTTKDWESWRIRNPLEPEERAFDVTHVMEARLIEATADATAARVASAPYPEILAVLNKKCPKDDTTASLPAISEESREPEKKAVAVPAASDSGTDSKLAEVARQLRTCQRELREREAQLRFVRDAYERDVFRLKEARYRAHVTGSDFGQEGQNDENLSEKGPISPCRPVIAPALGSSVLAHQFFRLFFGRSDMTLIAPDDYHKLKTAAIPPPPQINEAAIELKRLRRETEEIMARHADLSESAKVVAMRADAAESQVTELTKKLQGVPSA
jgi:hypothetical protein